MLTDAVLRYRRGLAVLESGDPAALDALAHELVGFPHGDDPYAGRRWITNAIAMGSKASVQWMLRQAVDLSFRDAEGYTPLHSALGRERPDRYEVLEMLLAAGAPVDLKGVNDWTPAHMAAAYDDVEALRILVRYGADLSIRTDIDDYATPLEEARTLGKREAVKYLEGIL
jgi:ankyrin repeat protein